MDEKKYVLQLFLADTTTQTKDAIGYCERYLTNKLGKNYHLEIVDVFEHPYLADAAQIIATPTIKKLFPEPVQKIVLDLHNEKKVSMSLNFLLQDDNLWSN